MTQKKTNNSNEIPRLRNKTRKQLAVRIETLMMPVTPQLRKTAIKKRASHPSLIREPDLDFRKLVDKLEQAENTLKLEEKETSENLKLQYLNNIQTITSHINNINDSDID